MILLQPFLACLLLIFWCVKFLKKGSNSEKGIREVPISGFAKYVFLNERPELILTKVSKKYGDVFFMKLGSIQIVSCCGFKAVKAMLSNKTMCDRPTSSFLQIRDPQKKLVTGLMSTNGKDWERLRVLVAKNLKVASEKLEEIFNRQIQKLLRNIELKHEIIDVHLLFPEFVLRILWEVLTSEEMQENDEEFQNFIAKNRSFFRNGNLLTNILFFTPSLQWTLKLFPSYRRFSEANTVLQKMVTKVVQRRKEAGYNSTCFIDSFIRGMSEQSRKAFNEQTLIVTVMDIFNAGAESTGNAIGFAMLRLLHYPNYYQRILEEIRDDQKVNSTKIQNRLPVFEAFLKEVMRISAVAPLSLPHSASEDTYLNGYGVIKKGCIAVANIRSVHRDPVQWKCPEDFLPERHLINGRISNSPGFIPYGLDSIFRGQITPLSVWFFMPDGGV
ncbi:hypothetical protein QYM36_004778, partial [Artemia franciscana]